MEMSNDELGRQLAAQLLGSDLKVALDDTGAQPAADNASDEQDPLETDFFRAVNAFRAARSGGDAQAIAAAEERLRDVVRSELTGGSR